MLSNDKEEPHRENLEDERDEQPMNDASHQVSDNSTNEVGAVEEVTPNPLSTDSISQVSDSSTGQLSVQDNNAIASKKKKRKSPNSNQQKKNKKNKPSNIRVSIENQNDSPAMNIIHVDSTTPRVNVVDEWIDLTHHEAHIQVDERIPSSSSSTSLAGDDASMSSASMTASGVPDGASEDDAANSYGSNTESSSGSSRKTSFDQTRRMFKQVKRKIHWGVDVKDNEEENDDDDEGGTTRGSKQEKEATKESSRARRTTFLSKLFKWRSSNSIDDSPKQSNEPVNVNEIEMKVSDGNAITEEVSHTVVSIDTDSLSHEQKIQYFRDQWGKETPIQQSNTEKVMSALSRPRSNSTSTSSRVSIDISVPAKTQMDHKMSQYFRGPSLFSVLNDDTSQSKFVTLAQAPSVIQEQTRFIEGGPNGSRVPKSGKEEAVEKTVKDVSEVDNANKLEDSVAVDMGVDNSAEQKEKDKKKKKKKKAHLLNGFDGVFVPCMCSVTGTILFLKVPWLVAQAGTGYSLLYLLISTIVALLTWTSISAMATNGFLPHGGPYYMISRILGAKFGGSVGLVYVLGFVFLCSLHTFAAGELVHSFIHEFWHDMRIIDPNASKPYWDLILFGFIFLVIVYIIVNIGIRHVAHLELLFMFVAVLCFISIIVGCFATTNSTYKLHGASWSRFKKNWGPHFGKSQDFFTVMAFIFPCVTGIMAGINRSGDLKNPQRAIPYGTLAAIITTTFMFLFMIIVFAFVGDREIMEKNYLDLASIVAYPYQKKVGYYFVKAGILLVIIGEAVQAMLVAPRIFQTIAADAVVPIPKIKFWAKIRANEPRRAILLVFVIAILPYFLGNLERIALLIAMFTLLCYSFLNIACVVTGLLRAPNWRPRFKLYHWTISLLGFISTSLIMFLLSWYWALLTFACAAGTYLLIAWRGRVTNFDDGLTGLKLKAALDNLYQLLREPEHTKNWRPQLLVLVKMSPEGVPSNPHILNMARQLKKGRGLCMVAAILEGDYIELHEEAKLQRAGLEMKMHEMGLKGFPHVIVSPTFDDGVRFLIQYSGLGALSPNTMMCSWPDNWREDSEEADHLVEILDYAHYTEKAVLVCKGMEHLPKSAKEIEPKSHIDVFWIAHDGGLMLMLGFLLRQYKVWRKCKLRIFTVIDKHHNVTDFEKQLKSLLYNLRINAEPKVIVCDHDSLNPYIYDSRELSHRRHSLMKEVHMSRAESKSNLDELYAHEMDMTESEYDPDDLSDSEESVASQFNKSDSSLGDKTDRRSMNSSFPVMRRTRSTTHMEQPTSPLMFPNRVKSMGNMEVLDSSKSPINDTPSKDPFDVPDSNTSNSNQNDQNEDPQVIVTVTDNGDTIVQIGQEEQLPDHVSQSVTDEHQPSEAVEEDQLTQVHTENCQPSFEALLHTSKMMNNIILEHAKDSQLLIINLPFNVPEISTLEYMHALDELTKDIPKCLLVRGGGQELITWYA